MREPGRPVVETGDDVRVEGSMSVAALDCTAGIGSSFQAIVKDTAGLGYVTARVEPEMARSRGAVVDAAVTEVHSEARCRKLALIEAITRQPGQIARAAGA